MKIEANRLEDGMISLSAGSLQISFQASDLDVAITSFADELLHQATGISRHDLAMAVIGVARDD